MIEALLEILDERWIARLEVTVWRPVRGVIDVVLQERGTTSLVAGEGQTELQAGERQLRRAAAKADALPSATGWPWPDEAGAPPHRGCSSCGPPRPTASWSGRCRPRSGVAYPARTRDACASPIGEAPWPGAAIPWADVAGARTRVLHGPPRGVPG